MNDKLKGVFGNKMSEMHNTSMKLKAICVATMIATMTGASGMVNARYVDGNYILDSGTVIAPDATIESEDRITAVGADTKDTTVTIDNGGTIYIQLDATDVSGTPSRIYALASRNNKNLLIVGNTNVDINVDSQRVDGIRANSGNIAVQGDLQVSAKSKTNEAYGVDVWYGATFDFEGNALNIDSSSESNQSFGMYVESGSAAILADSVSLTAKSSSVSQQNNTVGLVVQDGDVNIEAGDLVQISASAKNGESYGIKNVVNTGTDSRLHIKADQINISASSDSSEKTVTQGIYAYRSTIDLDGKTNLKVIGATNSLDEIDNVTYGVDATSDNNQKAAVVQFADDVVIDVRAGNEVLAVRPSFGSQIIFNGSNNAVIAHSENAGAYGIRAVSNGLVEVDGNIDLDVSTNGAYGAYGYLLKIGAILI